MLESYSIPHECNKIFQQKAKSSISQVSKRNESVKNEKQTIFTNSGGIPENTNRKINHYAENLICIS